MAEMTPQQMKFAEYYFDPKSETFSNALQSALRAGYSQETSKNITSDMPKWLSELLGKKNRLVLKAERNLESMLDTSDERIKADMTKFTLSRLKKEDYSDRHEVTGKGGESLTVNIVQYGSDNNPV